jgi:beta-phosphoglucomutase family hydrolase
MPGVHEGSIVDWTSFAAVLFDLDGVVTPTAEIHERAWAELFAPWDFDSGDYLAYVDGRPRYDGVRAFLDSRGVALPWGDPTDPPGNDTICAMGNRKDEMFNEVLARQGIEPYPGTIVVLDRLAEAHVPSAIVSSSKNARTVLKAARLERRFDAIVDGITAVDEQLAGKPDPAMFEHAAKCLDADRSRCVVVEDAISGVAAGRAGDFGLVVGVDRGGNRQALEEAGADLVVGDLSETIA